MTTAKLITALADALKARALRVTDAATEDYLVGRKRDCREKGREADVYLAAWLLVREDGAGYEQVLSAVANLPRHVRDKAATIVVDKCRPTEPGAIARAIFAPVGVKVAAITEAVETS